MGFLQNSSMGSLEQMWRSMLQPSVMEAWPSQQVLAKYEQQKALNGV
jgi:hypothetical protein